MSLPNHIHAKRFSTLPDIRPSNFAVYLRSYMSLDALIVAFSRPQKVGRKKIVDFMKILTLTKTKQKVKKPSDRLTV